MITLRLHFAATLSLALVAALAIASQASAQTEAATTTTESFLDKTHVGSYGEITATKEEGSTHPRLDVARFVLFLDHYFNDHWAFKSETEIEHVKLEASAMGGEVGLEQAYLDWHASSGFGWRVGLLLIPDGIINQTHEPTTFNGVTRPNFDVEVIPSTWREIGTGIYGDIAEGVKYQLYVTEGLNGLSFTPTGIYEGKQEGAAGNAPAVEGSDAVHPAISGKLEYLPMPGMRIGGSFYYQAATVGSNTPQQELVPIANFDAPLGAYFLDARYDLQSLHLRGEGGIETIGDAYRFERLLGGVNVPKQVLGGYVEAAYDLLPLFENEPTAEFSIFARYENYGFSYGLMTDNTTPPSLTRRILTAGLTLKPVDGIVLKLDWTNYNSSDAAKAVGTLRFGGGYAF